MEIPSFSTIDLMSEAELVELGREVHQQIGQLKRALDHIESRIENLALTAPTEPLVDADREGRRVTLASDSRAPLRVVFQSDLLIESFSENAAVHGVLAPLCGADFDQFFRRSVTYKRTPTDGRKWRLAVQSCLPSDTAALVIDAVKSRDKNGIPKSKTVFDW